MTPDRIILIRWNILFFIGNIFLFWIIGLRSLFSYSWLASVPLTFQDNIFVNIFTISSYLGNYGLLGLLAGCITLPIILIFPKRAVIFPIAILCATFLATLLFVDVSTYKLYRFHLNTGILDLALNGPSEKVWQLSSIESLLLMSFIIGTFILEIIWAYVFWRFLDKKILNGLFKEGICGIAVGSLIISYTILIVSSGSILNNICNSIARTLPFYTELFNAFMPEKISYAAISRLPANYLLPPNQDASTLKYPLQDLQCTPPASSKNLIIIVIDTWRFDMLDPIVTPNLNDFAKKSAIFTQHFSGGNSTAPGIFSLFYGIPASYWSTMQNNQREPVLIEQLRQMNYQMKILSSATLRLPAFNRTVFAGIRDLRLGSEGNSAYERDLAVTQEFQNFIEHERKNSQPFFSFLFYDAAHSYCDFKQDSQRFGPAIENCNHLNLSNSTDPVPYLNRYKNALFFVDQQIKFVLNILEKKNLLKDSVVIVTGDHGEEFNDNHEGFWGHASNFSHYQVQTPLIVYWPGVTPHIYQHKTSHFDVAPTLLSQLLNCENHFNTYSLGRNLFDTTQRPYLIAGSYTGYAIIEPDRIYNISHDGNVEIEHKTAMPFPEAKLDNAVLQNTFRDIHKFINR